MYFWNKTLVLGLGESKLYKKQTVMYLQELGAYCN